MTHTLPLAVVFRSAWGVSTGTGIAGGVDSIVEKDAAGRPVVRGTVLTGVIRERAVTAAQALDDGATDGPWSRFARDLFGPGPDDDGRRLVVPVKTGPIVTLAVEPGADERPALGQVRPGPRHQGHRAQG